MHADFVVVGSGPAGCACAAAIVEHARDATVIILERGAPSEDELSCRAAFPSCIARPASGYMPTLKLFQGCAWSGEGQVVGGGSAVNAGALLGDAAYWRGGWSAHGSSTLWGAEDMTRCESVVAARLRGPLEKCEPEAFALDAETSNFLDACHDAGYEARRDAPVSCLDAGARWQAFVPRNVLAWSARRRSAADLVYGHGRIRIVPGADVEKIEWCGTRATGVLLRSGAVVGATRVIVAGGAVSTAELLFRSGVGSEETIGKGVVIRSPALGRDVYDHVTVAVPLVDLRGALTAGEAALCAAAVLAAALRPGRAAVRVAAVVAVVVAAAALKLRPTAADACGRPAYRAVAFDDEAQLSFFPAQALVAMASILGGPDGGGPLPLHARSAFAVVARAARALRWGGGREPLALGAARIRVLATISQPETRSHLKLDAVRRDLAILATPTPPALSERDVLALGRAVGRANDVARGLSARRRCAALRFLPSDRVKGRWRRPQPSPITRALEAVAHWILRSVLRLDAGVVGTRAVSLEDPDRHRITSGNRVASRNRSARSGTPPAARRAARSSTSTTSTSSAPRRCTSSVRSRRPGREAKKGTHDAVRHAGAAAMPRLPRVNPMAMCYAMGWRLGEILATEHEARRAR